MDNSKILFCKFYMHRAVCTHHSRLARRTISPNRLHEIIMKRISLLQGYCSVTINRYTCTLCWFSCQWILLRLRIRCNFHAVLQFNEIFMSPVAHVFYLFKIEHACVRCICMYFYTYDISVCHVKYNCNSTPWTICTGSMWTKWRKINTMSYHHHWRVGSVFVLVHFRRN